MARKSKKKVVKWASKTDHVGNEGEVCPVCDNCERDDIEGGETNWEGTVATMKMKCLKCGATWTDVFHLCSYYPGEVGNYYPGEVGENA
jgi:C4-type Zn-finger protein